MPLVGYTVEAPNGESCKKRGAGAQMKTQRVEEYRAKNKVFGEMAKGRNVNLMAEYPLGA